MKRILLMLLVLFLYQGIFSSHQDIVFAREDKYIEPPLGRAYPIEHSEKYFFSVSGFNMKNESVEITINNGNVLLGSTEKGFTEAIIIPRDSKIVGRIRDMNIDSKLDNLYIRFNPAWYSNYLEQHLEKSPVADSIYAKAIGIHKQKFRNYSHAGWKALIPPEKVLLCDFDLTPSGMRVGSFFSKDKYVLLNNLSDLFDKYTDGKFTLYHPRNSVIKGRLKEWLDIRRDAFENICNFLKVDKERIERVIFYVFNSKEQGLKYGKKLGFAVPPQCEIYTLHNQTPGHELAHIVSYWINTKRIESALINEGLAVLLDQTERNYNKISKYLISSGTVSTKKLQNLLGASFRKQNYGYPLAASFVDFLIETHGLDKFIEFFAQEEYSESDSFIHFYGETGKELINKWKDHILKTDYGNLSDYQKEHLSRAAQSE